MKSEEWRDCVVTLIDVIGIKNKANLGNSKASKLMGKLHSLTQTSTDQRPSHEHTYCWNDSVLLLAFWDKKPSSGNRILREISELKRRIDKEIDESYAISVKGQAFPDNDQSTLTDNGNRRCVILKASSYAMANCFLIEEEAKKKRLRATWYVDSWLKQALGHTEPVSFLVKLLPSDLERKVFLFNGYLDGLR